MIRRRQRSDVLHVDGLRIAAGLTGTDAVLPLGRGHALVAGQTGGGKSVALRSLLYAAAGRPDVQLVCIDLKVIELETWRPRAITVATTRTDAVAVLGAYRTELDARLSALVATGATSWTTDLGPWLLLVVDELAELVRAPEDERRHADRALNLLDSLARLGRAVGIVLVLCTQHPSADVLTTALRGQLAYTLALRTRDESTAKMICQGAACDLAHLGDLGVGFGYWLSPDLGGPVLCRPDFYSPADAARRASDTAHLRAPLASGVGAVVQTPQVPPPWPSGADQSIAGDPPAGSPEPGWWR